ncbi:MAG: acyl-CoA dehydrogenase [Deltaproteobacteria bacterium]|nr:MAG: acyl-CoA dehydrogenase [Deltaproteobacteria bacterium]
MEFLFSEDQEMLAQTIRDFLAGECTASHVRGLWETETGRSPEFWQKLTEIGLPALLIPEEHGGLGLCEVDATLVFEETGRAALAEPLIATAAVAAPLLREIGGDLASTWLPRIAAGEALVAVGHAQSPFVADAHVADLLLLPDGDDLHAVVPEAVSLVAEKSNDQSQRLFSVAWTPSADTNVAEGPVGAALQDAALDRGALACASEQLGVCSVLIEMGALYASQRKQFGVAIGTFQAVKHRLANAKVKLEYARAVVHRAANSVATAAATRAADVSMAKVAASEAATFAAKESLQVHGAIGYTYEQDLHVWMKRAWSHELAWGTGAFHRGRVSAALFDGQGAIAAFGFQPREAA